MKYHIITLGCQMNMSDSERVLAVLDDMDYMWTDDATRAQLIGVLTCSVRQKAIDKVYTHIHKWNQWKNHKNLITFVSGCILPKDHKRFLTLFDLVFQMKDLPQLPEMIKQYGVNTPMGYTTNFENPNDNIDKFWKLKPKYLSEYESFIPIQNGCDKFCTFCAVPYTRGREVSRSSDEIINELIDVVNRGYKSITLLGQNVNSYGLDRQKTEISFSQLLEKIGTFGKESGQKFWVYFTSPHPKDMTRDVIDIIAEYDCLAKQIHLPIQSGDDMVLKRMNRKHNVEKYRHIVKYVRKKLPEATLFTDIIVGFTGETDIEFRNTLYAMKEFQYNMAYIAQYSPRPGTRSAEWIDDIPKKTKKERLHAATLILQKTSQCYTRQLIGETVKVLITGRSKRKPEYLLGYTEGKINMRLISQDDTLIGKFVQIKVTSVTALSIEGKLTEKSIPIESTFNN